jgi:signal transduction histidine kinase
MSDDAATKIDPAAHPPQHFILSTLSPSATQTRLALAVVCGILVVFSLLTVGPLKGLHLERVDAFVPAYVTTMFICDFITALLLHAQFAIVRTRAILLVASAYLFAALVMIPFILVFPGVFVADRGLVGGMQSTSWVYFFQHAGFPLFILAYALLKDRDYGQRSRQGEAVRDIAVSVATTIAIVAGGALLFIEGAPLLLQVTTDSMHFGPLWWYPATGVLLLNAAAITVLWSRRRVALDLWLLVVMFLYVVEIPLSYYPDPRRFSSGWYAVRGFGVLASGIVLMLLIHEIATLYGRLLRAVNAQHREREARLMTGDAVAASIAHEVKQPLTAMVTAADAGLRFLDRSTPNVDKAKDAFRRIVADGHRAGEVVDTLRATFRNDARERTSLDLNELIQESLALGRNEFQRHGIVVHTESNRPLLEVRANRVQLQQVLLNLIMNAVDAMATRDEPRILSVKSEASPGDSVIVSVADTGTGIGAHDVDHIFDPLYSTKSNGMGMGLSICRAIIEAHQGRLWFAPNTPRGAVFRFTLQSNPAVLA